MSLFGVYSQKNSKGFILQNITTNEYTAKLTNSKLLDEKSEFN